MGNRPYSTEAGWGRLGTGKRRCYNGFNMARPLSLPRTVPRLQLWVWARRFAPAFALPLILAAALALRLYGIDWDQGNLFHADERDLLMRVDRLALPPASDLGVLLNAEESPWNPGWFNYGSLPLYALKGVDLAAAAFTDLDIFQLRYPGRAISALADTLTVLVAYGLALRLGRGRAAGASGAGKGRGAGRIDRRAPLLAAAFLAVAVLHIQLSHFFAPDTLMTLFVLLSLYGAVRAAQGGRLGWSALAGAGLGLALGTKFSAAPLLLPLGLAHALPAWRAWREGRDDWWRAPATGLVLAAAVGDCGAFSGPTVRVSGLGRVLEGPRRAGGDGAPGGGLPLHSAVCGYAAVPVPSAAAGGVRPGAAPGAGGLGGPALRAGAMAAAAGPGAAGASGVGGALPCGDGGLSGEVHSLSAAGDAAAGDLRGADAGVCGGLGAGTG